GLRESPDDVEREGIRRAEAEIARADRVLFVIDTPEDPDGRAFVEESKRLPEQIPVTLIFNKCDLASGIPVADTIAGPPRITVSALHGQGIEQLRAHLKSCMGYNAPEAGTVSARQRHLDALMRARRSVEKAAPVLTESRAGELVAE